MQILSYFIPFGSFIQPNLLNYKEVHASAPPGKIEIN